MKYRLVASRRLTGVILCSRGPADLQCRFSLGLGRWCGPWRRIGVTSLIRRIRTIRVSGSLAVLVGLCVGLDRIGGLHRRIRNNRGSERDEVGRVRLLKHLGIDVIDWARRTSPARTLNRRSYAYVVVLLKQLKCRYQGVDSHESALGAFEA